MPMRIVGGVRRTSIHERFVDHPVFLIEANPLQRLPSNMPLRRFMLVAPVHNDFHPRRSLVELLQLHALWP